MTNAESMIRDARRRGGPVSVNFCLMRANASELPDVLEWAESHRVPVNVSVVRSPRALSLVDAPTAEISSIAASLRRPAPIGCGTASRSTGLCSTPRSDGSRRGSARVPATFGSAASGASRSWSSPVKARGMECRGTLETSSPSVIPART